MSVTSTPLTVHTEMPKASWRSHASVYIVFLFCASLYLFPFMRLLLGGSDEGLLVSGALRVAHGQVFARDFFEIVGPGTFYWLALFFKLFGVTFFAERICLFITSIGTAFLMYWLSRKICSQYRELPCIVLAGTYFGIIWPTISHHIDSNLFALLSVAFAVLWHDKRRSSLLFATGALAGLTTCFLQPKGILLLLALVIWLVLLRIRESAPLASTGFLVGGYVATVGLMLLYFWSQHALWDLIYANYLWPSKHYAAANVVPYAQGVFRDYWESWAAPTSTVRWTAVTASVLVIPFIFVAILPALLPVLGLWKSRQAQKPEVILYWLCGWALWFAEVHRKDICHLVFGSPLLIILCVYYLAMSGGAGRLMLRVLAVGSVSLAVLNFFLVLSAHPMPTRVGTVMVFKSDPALAFLDNHVAPGQEIFVYPDAPIYYYLSATRNPTRWSGLGYNYNSPSDFQEVVQVLEQRRVRYVVWDTLLEDRALKLFFSIKQARPEERIIEPYFASHYKAVWEQDGIRVMERVSDAPTH
jgi:4-amino-4-deoxy-L-arabinose transferase-like glycosyltransferase